jgi:hypothetical protein
VRDCSWIAGRFPNIRPDNFKCCSDRTTHLPNNGYNCIAWAAGKTDKWWWPIDVPGAFWPIPIDPVDPENIKHFIKAFETEGYCVCADGRFENGFEKVAIYEDSNGDAAHAARQLPEDVWTSKMGKYEDIEHDTPQVVENQTYGIVKVFLKRPNPLCQKTSSQKTWFSRLLEFLRMLLKRLFPTAKKNQTSS